MHEQVARCSASGPESLSTALAQDQFAACIETAQVYPENASVAELAERALATPDAVAVVSVGEARSYQRITITFVPTTLAELMMASEWPPRTPWRAMLAGADTPLRFPPTAPPFMVANNFRPSEFAVLGVVPTSGDAGGQPCH